MHLHWNGTLDLTRAAELHAELRDALAAHDLVELTVDEVESMDLSFAQILLAADRTAARDGKRFVLHSDGPQLRDLCRDAGLDIEIDQLTAEVNA